MSPAEPAAIPDEYEPVPTAESDPHEPLMGYDEQQAVKPEGRPGDSTARLFALVSVLGLTATTWVLIFTNDPGALGWFALHPTLQTLALSCFTFGILTLQPTAQPKTKAAGLQRHQVYQLSGLAAILLGTAFMFYNKTSHGADHFTSWHGLFGIVTVALLVLQVLIGGAGVWFGGAALGGGTKAKSVWKYHRLMGYVVFPLMLFTVYLAGAWSTWVTGHSAHIVRFAAYSIAPAVLLATVYGRVRTSKMKFF